MAPRTLLSDRGTNFLSTLVREVCNLYSIKKLNTSVYNPKCDGLVELLLSTFVKIKRIGMFSFRELCLHFGLHFQRLQGKAPLLLPMDVSLLPPIDPASSIAEHRRRILKQIELAQQIAKENIMGTQQKSYQDTSAAEPNFIEGQNVWLFTPKTKKGLSKKLLHNYHKPYRIVEKLSPVHYRLHTSGNNPVSSIVHANRMKHFFDPNEHPIEPPIDDPTDEPYLAEDDLPENSFEKSLLHVSEPASGEEIVPRFPNESPVTYPNTESESLIDNQTVLMPRKFSMHERLTVKYNTW